MSPLYRKLFEWLGRNDGLGPKLLRILERTFTACTPAFAAPYQIAQTGNLLTPLSAAIFGAAFVQCFILTGALSWLSGTLTGAPGRSVGFFDDKWNIFLYTLICPAYVTLCVRLVLLSMGRDPDDTTRAPASTTSAQAKRLFACVFLACLFSSILITNYVADAINPAVVRPVYWFLDSSTGIRRLNSAGLYYIVLNFTLLFITFLGGAAFIGISIDGIRLSRALLDSATPIDFRTYGKRLNRLVVAYFFGTLLVFFYAINIIVWKESPLGGTANIDIAGAMLTALGIFFVAIPKRFIEHAWATYTARGRAVAEDEEGQPRALPLPRSWTRSIWVANVLCIGGWFPYFYGIRDYIDPYYWLQQAFGA